MPHPRGGQRSGSDRLAKAIEDRLKQLKSQGVRITNAELGKVVELQASSFSAVRQGRRGIVTLQALRLSRELARRAGRSTDAEVDGYVAAFLDDAGFGRAIPKMIAPNTTVRRVLDRKRIRAAWVNYCPFSYLTDTSPKEPSGFAVRLFRQFARMADLECEWVECGWSEIIPGLHSGDIDVVATLVFATPRRQFHTHFIELLPALGAGLNAVCMKSVKNGLIKDGDPLSLDVLDRPKGPKIVVVEDELGHEFARSMFEPDHYHDRVKVADTEDIYEMLEQAVEDGAIGLADNLCCREVADTRLADAECLFAESQFRIGGGIVCDAYDRAWIDFLENGFKILTATATPFLQREVDRYYDRLLPTEVRKGALGDWYKKIFGYKHPTKEGKARR